MLRRIILVGSCALLGAGCQLETRLPSPAVSVPIQEQTLETPIPQRNGFGDIPRPPLPPRKPGAQGSVRVLEEFPELPPASTVLRIRSGQPNAAELRNIAQALELPEGVLGRTPRAGELLIEWTDEAGRMWAYRGSESLVRFRNPTIVLPQRIGASLPEDALKDHALGFLRSIGYDLTRIGQPYIDAEGARPGVAVVRFNAKQDGQGIWSGSGAAWTGATVEVERSSGQVVDGSFLVRHDPDRSDYPLITRDEARKQMAQGGLGGVPTGDVAVDAISFEWFQITDENEPPTFYLYPALIGTGSIAFPDKRTAPYRIVVPLTQ